MVDQNVPNTIDVVCHNVNSFVCCLRRQVVRMLTLVRGLLVLYMPLVDVFTQYTTTTVVFASQVCTIL